MCDPISFGLGVLGAASVRNAVQGRKEAKAAAAQSRDQLAMAGRERERVETEAVQASQAEMARTKGRRRQSLLGSMGSLNAPTAEGTKMIQPAPSMLSRGANFMGG